MNERSKPGTQLQSYATRLSEDGFGIMAPQEKICEQSLYSMPFFTQKT